MGEKQEKENRELHQPKKKIKRGEGEFQLKPPPTWRLKKTTM